MWDNIDADRHFLGEFCLRNKSIHGEIVYNKASGSILLMIRNRTPESLGSFYDTIPLITGKLDSGAPVSLYHNRCVENHTQLFAYQDLVFKSSYVVMEPTQNSYNQLICILENGLQWSGLSQLDTSDFQNIRPSSVNDRVYHWFNSKITFNTWVENEVFTFPRKEVSKVVERLIVKIDCNEKQSPAYFMQVRDKIISLISFAIKDNVNIEEQYLVDFDDFEEIGSCKRYCQKSLLSSEPYSPILGTNPHNFNFTLGQLPNVDDIQDTLIKLEPIFNLYLSLFKYQRMPPEMVFLNIVQALETFHSRFRYDDKKENYVESVNQRFGDDEQIKSLLLSDTQMDENCRYIILVSRLNDLLIGDFNGLFLEFYWNTNYAQTIADTRHYYTHYGQSKQSKALKGDDLLDAIFILRLLLEYHICKVLNIDIEKDTRHQISNFLIRKDVRS